MTADETTPATNGGTAHGADRFAEHPRLHGHRPEHGHDTHGLPWAGRSVEAARYADDDGSPDPVVLDALRRVADAATPDDERALLAALSGSRLLVPIVAAPDDDGDTLSGMSTALLRGPDGSLALPAFTGTPALTAWDAAARPVPTPVPEVAQAALEQHCDAVVLDLADAHATVLRSSQLWALARRETWLPAHQDPAVRLAVAEAAVGLDGVLGVRAEDGSLHAPGTVRLVVHLRPGLPADVVESLVDRLGRRLAEDPDIRRRIDDLAVVLRQAPDDGADIA